MLLKFFDELRNYDLKILSSDGAMGVARRSQDFLLHVKGQGIQPPPGAHRALKSTMGKCVALTAHVMSCLAERKKPRKTLLLGGCGQHQGRHFDNQVQLSGAVVKSVPQGVCALFSNTQFIVQILARFAKGEKRYALAREFGVHFKTVEEIVRRRSWRHVPERDLLERGLKP